MIREWLRPDGVVVRYDSTTDYVELRDSSGAPLETPHPATDSERAEYYTFYPDATQEEMNAKSSITGQLMAALTSARNATADNTVTPQEFAEVNPLVQIALKAYRDYPYKHPEVDRLAFLVLSQVSYAYSLLLTSAAQRNAIITNNIFVFETRIAQLEAQVASLNLRLAALEVP
jgi:hypothetical protein